MQLLVITLLQFYFIFLKKLTSIRRKKLQINSYKNEEIITNVKTQEGSNSALHYPASVEM